MRVIKAKYPDGSLLYSAFPTSTKEVRRIFWVYGLDAWLTKINGQHYHIMYPQGTGQGAIFYNTDQHRVDCFTAKHWLEIGKKNSPASNNFREGYSKFAWWGNLDQYINKETLGT